MTPILGVLTQSKTHHNDLLVFTQSYIIVTCFYQIFNPLILRSSSSQKGSYQEQDSSNREDGQSIFSSQVSNFCCDLKSNFNASSLPQGRVWAGSAAEGSHPHRGATPRRSLRGQSFIDWSSARVLSKSQDHLLWRGQRWAQQQYFYVVYSLKKPSIFRPWPAEWAYAAEERCLRREQPSGWAQAE